MLHQVAPAWVTQRECRRARGRGRLGIHLLNVGPSNSTARLCSRTPTSAMSMHSCRKAPHGRRLAPAAG